MVSYPLEDFAADSSRIRDTIWAETGVVIELEYRVALEMIKTIESVTRKWVIDHDELRGILMGRYDFVSDQEETGYERLLIKYHKRRLGQKRHMDALHGRFAPTPPIEAYEQ